MKPFDLEAAKRGEPIVTRDGRKAKFVAHVPEVNVFQRMVCVVEDEVVTYSEDGQYTINSSHRDLFMAPPPMRSINGHEYPEPVREPLENGQEYFVADQGDKHSTLKYYWVGSAVELIWLKRGLIHLTREAAEAHARAIILAGGGEV